MKNRIEAGPIQKRYISKARKEKRILASKVKKLQREQAKVEAKELYGHFEFYVEREQMMAVRRELVFLSPRMNCGIDKALIDFRLEKFFRENPEEAANQLEESVLTVYLIFKEILEKRFEPFAKAGDTRSDKERSYEVVAKFIEMDRRLTQREKDRFKDLAVNLFILQGMSKEKIINYVDDVIEKTKKKLMTEQFSALTLEFLTQNRIRLSNYYRIINLSRANYRFYNTLDTEPDEGLDLLDLVHDDMVFEYIKRDRDRYDLQFPQTEYTNINFREVSPKFRFEDTDEYVLKEFNKE